MSENSLSPSEREELEQLRALKAKQDAKEREMHDKLELEELRQEQQREAEKRQMARQIIEEKRESFKEQAKRDKMYAQGELPPMPLVQKIILVAVFIIMVAVIIYILKFYEIL